MPRFLLIDWVCIIELHGVAIAEKEAYEAHVYLPCINSSKEIKITLLCYKYGILPIQQFTIPCRKTT